MTPQRYLAVTAVIEGAGLAAAAAVWFGLPEHRWLAALPLLVAAVAFLKLVHRVVKPPRTGAEER